jgi:hypothetical protein
MHSVRLNQSRNDTAHFSGDRLVTLTAVTISKQGTAIKSREEKKTQIVYYGDILLCFHGNINNVVFITY